MNPGQIGRLDGTKVVEYRAPKDWDEKRDGVCEPLKVRLVPDASGGMVMQSAWYPSEEERRALAAGGHVLLSIWGAAHPPVSVQVEQP